MTQLNVNQAVDYLAQSNVIAYPTEAVFGLGCHPDDELALNRLLALKHRPEDKGLIVIGAHLNQLIHYIDINAITDSDRQLLLSPSDHPITWLVPKKRGLSRLLTGKFETIAIRITSHPVVCELCTALGHGIVSTSANLAGQTPCRTANEVWDQFGEAFPVLMGDIMGYQSPSEIRDLKTQHVIRAK